MFEPDEEFQLVLLVEPQEIILDLYMTSIEADHSVSGSKV